MAEFGYFEIGCKKLHFEKNDFEIYESGFWDFWEKINFKTFYAQNYSQKVCSGSILNRPIHFLGLFYTKKAPSYTLTSFYGCYNAYGYIYILLKLKNKKKFPLTNSYILGICSWMVFLSISAKNQEKFILTRLLFFTFL